MLSIDDQDAHKYAYLIWRAETQVRCRSKILRLPVQETVNLYAGIAMTAHLSPKATLRLVIERGRFHVVTPAKDALSVHIKAVDIVVSPEKRYRGLLTVPALNSRAHAPLTWARRDGFQYVTIYSAAGEVEVQAAMQPGESVGGWPASELVEVALLTWVTDQPAMPMERGTSAQAALVSIRTSPERALLTSNLSSLRNLQLDEGDVGPQPLAIDCPKPLPKSPTMSFNVTVRMRVQYCRPVFDHQDYKQKRARMEGSNVTEHLMTAKRLTVHLAQVSITTPPVLLRACSKILHASAAMTSISALLCKLLSALCFLHAVCVSTASQQLCLEEGVLSRQIFRRHVFDRSSLNCHSHCVLKGEIGGHEASQLRSHHSCFSFRDSTLEHLAEIDGRQVVPQVMDLLAHRAQLQGPKGSLCLMIERGQIHVKSPATATLSVQPSSGHCCIA